MRTNATSRTDQAFRQLCLIVRDCLSQHGDDDYAELAEAIKLQLARYRLRYTPADLHRAMTLVIPAKRQVYRQAPVDLPTQRTDWAKVKDTIEAAGIQLPRASSR